MHAQGLGAIAVKMIVEVAGRSEPMPLRCRL
jgi:hypothetical protein